MLRKQFRFHCAVWLGFVVGLTLGCPKGEEKKKEPVDVREEALLRVMRMIKKDSDFEYLSVRDYSVETHYKGHNETARFRWGGVRGIITMKAVEAFFDPEAYFFTILLNTPGIYYNAQAAITYDGRDNRPFRINAVGKLNITISFFIDTNTGKAKNFSIPSLSAEYDSTSLNNGIDSSRAHIIHNPTFDVTMRTVFKKHLLRTDLEPLLQKKIYAMTFRV